MMHKRAQRDRTTVVWGSITLAFITLFTPIASATSSHPTPRPRHSHADDCDRVIKADRSLCAKVWNQPAYGWTYGPGHQGRATNPPGYIDVHDVTHQGYSRAEIHDNLTGLREQYEEHVTRVTVNVARLRPGCQYIVETIPDDGPNGTGIRLTQVVTVCP